MKLNKFFFGLLMTPAVMMVGCGDYEDTEVASPEADADAIGAYFESSAVSEQLSPGQTSFKIVLNRASFSEAPACHLASLFACRDPLSCRSSRP